jgi:uncharacterized protein YdaU (DUF1376 family)
VDGFPWFKIYAEETLADEGVIQMSLAERGLWFTCLCRCWAEGSIPADPAKLARLIGEDATAMRPHFDRIADRFAPHDADALRLVSPRLERERADAIAQAEKKGEAGRKAADARWSQRKGPDATALRPHCDGNAKKNQKEKQNQKQPPPGGGGTPDLEGFRAKLADALGVPHVGPGQGSRGLDACRRWLAAGYPEDDLVAECVRIAGEKGVTPAHLTWWAGWLGTVSDKELELHAQALQRRTNGGMA